MATGPVEDDLAAYLDLLESRGISLEHMGIGETALGREDALLAIGLLENALVPVLGGDVYLRRGPEIVPAYANWYCDRLEGESEDVYVRRCGAAARTYVERVPQHLEDVPVFVVVTNRICGGEGCLAGS